MEDYVTVLKNARQQMTSRSESISVTDITLCPRKKVFSKIYPVQMTDRELFEYVTAQACHDLIERLLMLVYPERFRVETKVQFKNVIGKLDVFDKPLNGIVEIKISKLGRIPLKPFSFHEAQVKYYMSMIGSDEAQILYMLDNFQTYRSFEIFMTAEERIQVLDKLEREGQDLQNALDKKDPSLARGIYGDPDIRWMCQTCPYADKCSAIRGEKDG